MSDFLEYTKGGDILIAPSLNYKHQYVLKCDLCEEFFTEFDQFFSHYLSHYDMNSSEEDENVSEPGSMEEEQQLYNDIMADEDDDIDVGINENEREQMADIEEEETPSSFKEEFDGDLEEFDGDEAEFDGDEEKVDGDNDGANVMAKDETASLEDPDMNYSHMEMVQEPLELAVIPSKTHDDEEYSKNAETTDTTLPVVVKESSDVADKSNIEFVKNFMKSKENVTALIAAYKNESHLWDFNVPVYYREKEERNIMWNKIAMELMETRDIEIKNNQVAACIIYLRHKYRERKRCGELVGKDVTVILPNWVFKQLQFLNPFVESKPIGLLDVHQDLTPKQNIQILNIFKRCPHLWDTNTFEYYCTNKRSEALTAMTNMICEEIGLDVDEDTLQNYIMCIRNYFVLERRRKKGYIKGVSEKVKYYEHLTFLSDHLGPFKCSYCSYSIVNPLTLKAHECNHAGTVPFQCPKCDKEFRHVDTYVYHMRRHMDDFNHVCQVCGKRFIRALEVTAHMRCHTGDKPFCCDICGSSFGHRTGFARHVKLMHRKRHMRDFCPQCGKGFYSKGSLNIHLRTHRDDRDFVCSICGKAFKTKSTLKSHVATHENGNYECNVCGKTFKNRINLWQHKRKHRLNSIAYQKPESPSPFLDIN